MTIERRAYTAHEAAVILGVHKTTVLGWVKAERIPFLKIGRTIRIPVWWVEEQTSKPKPLRTHDL